MVGAVRGSNLAAAVAKLSELPAPKLAATPPGLIRNPQTTTRPSVAAAATFWRIRASPIRTSSGSRATYVMRSRRSPNGAAWVRPTWPSSAGETKPDIEQILRSRHARFEVWRLIRILTALGADIGICVSPVHMCGAAAYSRWLSWSGASTTSTVPMLQSG